MPGRRKRTHIELCTLMTLLELKHHVLFFTETFAYMENKTLHCVGPRN